MSVGAARYRNVENGSFRPPSKWRRANASDATADRAAHQVLKGRRALATTRSATTLGVPRLVLCGGPERLLHETGEVDLAVICRRVNTSRPAPAGGCPLR